MTLDQFLEQLEQTPRNWYFFEVGSIKAIRCGKNNRHCPLTRVAGVDQSGIELKVAARKLGLTDKTARRIADCADDAEEYMDGYTTLRRRLEKACGLS